MRSARARGAFETALLAAGLLALFFLLPHEFTGDDNQRFAIAERLIHHGELVDSPYPLIGPVVSAPLVLLGDVFRYPEWWATRFNVVVVALGLLAAYVLLRDRVDRSLLRRVFLLLLFCSMFTNRLRDYNAEVFTAVLVGLGIVSLRTRYRAAGWAAIVLGTLNVPAALGGLGLVSVYLMLVRRRFGYLLPLAAAVGLFMLESWARRGAPLTTGYEGDHGFRTLLPYSGEPGFSYPFLFGMLSILFSFGKGILFFVPGLLYTLSGSLRSRLGGHREPFVLMLLFLLGLILVYSRWWAWYGGFSWGPRYFVFASIPASMLLALLIRRPPPTLAGSSLALLVLTLSAWVGTSGAIFSLASLDVCTRSNYAVEAFCWYVPEFSVLWNPIVDFPPMDARAFAVVAFCAVAFLYLAAPLAGVVARQLAERARAVPSLAEWARAWRF